MIYGPEMSRCESQWSTHSARYRGYEGRPKTFNFKKVKARRKQAKLARKKNRK